MKNALIVSNPGQGLDNLVNMIAEAGCQVDTAPSCGHARRALIDNDYDLCVINAPLSDESGIEFSRFVMESGAGQAVLIIRSELYDEVSEKVEDVGVFTLSKPINRALLWNVLKLCQASVNRMRRMRAENEQLQKKIEDIRIIDRAKCVLIEYLKLSEEQAHKYIERHAMDMRVSRRSVAENVLKTYEY